MSDKKIEKFIADIKFISPERAKLASKLRDMYKSPNKDLYEKFIYGGIGIYLGDKLLGGVWVYENHVSVIFSDGYKLKDPDKILEGGGKFRRHVKIVEEGDISHKKVKSFIKQIVDLEK